MTDRIPAKFRYIAAIHHLILGIVTGAIAIGIVSFAFRDNQGMNGLNVIFFLMLSMVAHLGILVVSFIFWMLTSWIHPFVQLAGKDTTAYSMNNALIFTIVLIFSYLCSLLFRDGTNMNIMIAMMSLTEIVYSINSVVCGIFVIRGYHFKNKFICPFTRGN